MQKLNSYLKIETQIEKKTDINKTKLHLTIGIPMNYEFFSQHFTQ